MVVSSYFCAVTSIKIGVFSKTPPPYTAISVYFAPFCPYLYLYSYKRIMKNKRYSNDLENVIGKNEAEKLKERLVKDIGRIFRRPDFYPIDPEGLIFERNFHEIGETVQVRLTKNRKIEAVYLTRRH